MSAGTDIFDRILCGIDGSPQSFEALRQAERLRPQTGELHLATVAELSVAVHGGFAAPVLYDEIMGEATGALARAGEKAASSVLVVRT